MLKRVGGRNVFVGRKKKTRNGLEKCRAFFFFQATDILRRGVLLTIDADTLETDIEMYGTEESSCIGGGEQ